MHTHFLSSFPYTYQIHLDLMPSMQSKQAFTGPGIANFNLTASVHLFPRIKQQLKGNLP